jgi:hypothetical protein
MVLWILAAVAGVLLVAGVTAAASSLSTQTVGLSSEPLSAGEQLTPRATAEPTATPTPKPKARKKPERTPTPTPAAAPTAVPTAVPTVDDHGGGDDHSGKGGGGSDNSGHGGGSDD